MQPKPRKYIYVLALFSLLIIGTFFWEWPYSPLHKVVAWGMLKSSAPVSAEQATKAMSVLTNGRPPEEAANIDIPYFEISEETIEVEEAPLSVRMTTSEDPLFVASMKYTFPYGEIGIFEQETRIAIINGHKSMPYFIAGRLLRKPIDEVIYTGTRPQDELKKEFLEQWKVVVKDLKKRKLGGAEQLLSAAEVELFSKSAKLSDIEYRLAPTASIAFAVGAETTNTIQVGTLSLQQKDCTRKGEIPIIYLKDQREYRFDGVHAALAKLCAKPKEFVETLTCSNCWLAPVGKKQALPATYAPYVVATGLSGGAYVTPDTKTALTKLFADAKAKGITTIRVSSGFRSYSWQDTLFNTYVNNEKKTGLTTAQATEKANTYSAKPGHSEHQLGTTVDLMACKSPCSFYDSANNPLFSYLNANAHKFGFIISYPNGSQPFTGYIYEPWHVRYVGTTLANELYNHGYLTKKGYYLEQFLREKGKY